MQSEFVANGIMQHDDWNKDEKNFSDAIRWRVKGEVKKMNIIATEFSLYIHLSTIAILLHFYLKEPFSN